MQTWTKLQVTLRHHLMYPLCLCMKAPVKQGYGRHPSLGYERYPFPACGIIIKKKIYLVSVPSSGKELVRPLAFPEGWERLCYANEVAAEGP